MYWAVFDRIFGVRRFGEFGYVVFLGFGACFKEAQFSGWIVAITVR